MSWAGFKKNVNRATTQVMMKTGHVEKTNDRDYEVEERPYGIGLAESTENAIAKLENRPTIYTIMSEHTMDDDEFEGILYNVNNDTITLGHTIEVDDSTVTSEHTIVCSDDDDFEGILYNVDDGTFTSEYRSEVNDETIMDSDDDEFEGILYNVNVGTITSEHTSEIDDGTITSEDTMDDFEGILYYNVNVDTVTSGHTSEVDDATIASDDTITSKDPMDDFEGILYYNANVDTVTSGHTSEVDDGTITSDDTITSEDTIDDFEGIFYHNGNDDKVTSEHTSEVGNDTITSEDTIDGFQGILHNVNDYTARALLYVLLRVRAQEIKIPVWNNCGSAVTDYRAKPTTSTIPTAEILQYTDIGLLERLAVLSTRGYDLSEEETEELEPEKLGLRIPLPTTDIPTWIYEAECTKWRLHEDLRMELEYDELFDADLFFCRFWDTEYDIELTENDPRRYRTMEAASMRLQKEAKGYLDSLRAMTASQMRIAETIDAFYGDSGAKDGVSRSYKQAVEDLDAETIKALDGPYRTTVLEPISRFCAYFPDINECIKKRNHKLLDYDAMRAKVKKLAEKPDKDVTKLPRAEKEEAMARAAYEQLNEQLYTELPQLIDLRVPYLDPSFEALVKIQLRFCAEAYSRMAQVQQYLDADTREQYAQGQLDSRVDDILQEIRGLSISGAI